MSSWARKIIEAIQHSMLGDLSVLIVFQAFNLSIFWSLATNARALLLVGSLGLTSLILGLGAWILGHLARASPPRTGPVWAAQKTSNGFEVWNLTPEGGLRPHPVVRAMVSGIGRRSTKGVDVFALALLVSAFAAITALWWAPDRQWARLHPWFADPSNQNLVWFVAALAILAASVRRWATDQRRKLGPTPTALPEIA